MAQPFSRTTRSLARDSGRASRIALGAAALGLAAWGGWFAFGRVTVYEVAPHARIETGAAPRDITALQAGRLASADLQIGRRVKAGDLLAELDTTAEGLRAEEDAVVRDAYPARIAALRQQIAALERSVGDDREASAAASAAARARFQEAQADAALALDRAQRIRTLGDKGLIAPMEVAKATTEAQKATAARDALAADARRVDLDARTRASQVQAQIEDLNRTLAGLQSESAATGAVLERRTLEAENRRLRAPVDGVIAEAATLRAGAYVAEGQKLATIVPAGGGLTIIAEFNPATALGRLRPGQTARLRLDGYPWAQYGVVEARVLRVAGEVRDRGLRAELVPLKPPGHGLVLRHGLTGAVEVGVETASPAALVLRAAGRMVDAPAVPATGSAR